jgi:ABC-type multidrug transport system fused ATPase/permease subunit
VTNPEIIVLDEATSALDGKTEFLVSEAIKSLEGTVTILVIAHRLSTVKNFERVMYFDNGKLKAVGSFKTLVAQYPDIAEQAALVSI